MLETLGFFPLYKDSKGNIYKNKPKIARRPLFFWVYIEANISNLNEIVIYMYDEFINAYISENDKWIDKLTVMEHSIVSDASIANNYKILFVV